MQDSVATRNLCIDSTKQCSSIKSSQFFSYQGSSLYFTNTKKNKFILDICELIYRSTGKVPPTFFIKINVWTSGVHCIISNRLETTYFGDSNIGSSWTLKVRGEGIPGYKKFCYYNRIKLDLQKQSFLTPELYTSPSSYGQFNN